MAIQLPNPGLGDGQTGDNEFVMWTKVKNNFDNNTHAASRLVGESSGNVMQVGAFGLGVSNNNLVDYQSPTPTGFYVGFGATASENYPEILPFPAKTGVFIRMNRGLSVFTLAVNNGGVQYSTQDDATSIATAHRLYGTNNTTLDGNGALKPSSPVLRVFSDHIEGNDDGDAMGATYTKNGVGDYTITGTTGLRTDGWYVVIPNDMNGNPKVAITLDDTDGVITLRSYVRIFDMTTFKFVPDLEQPLDIPEGRWIDLRFNDLPDEPMPQEV